MGVPQADAVTHFVGSCMCASARGDVVQPKTALFGESVGIPGKGRNAEQGAKDARLLARNKDIDVLTRSLRILILHVRDVLGPF